MKGTHYTRVAVPSVVRYATVAVAALLGFLTLLVAVSHPVPVGTAVGGAVTGVALGRAHRRVESHLRRPAADGDELPDPSLA